MVLKHFSKKKTSFHLHLSLQFLLISYFSLSSSLSSSLLSSIVSLFISSLFNSSLLLSFSSLFSLFSSLVLIFSSVVFRLLLPSCLVSSSSLPSSLLSFSVFFPYPCLSPSPCDVACCVVLCCVVVVWGTLKTPCVDSKRPPCLDSKRPRVCRHHEHMLKHLWVWCRYTRRRFESRHGGRSERTHAPSPPLPTQTDTHTHTQQTQHQRNICGVVWCGVCCANFLLTMNGPRGVITWS